MTISAERIVDISGGTSYKLVEQPISFTFDYNPELNTASVRVDFIQMLDVDGVSRNVNMGNKGTTRRQWSAISSFYPCTNGETDPVSGADLTNISLRGVMLLLLEMFDKMRVQDNT